MTFAREKRLWLGALSLLAPLPLPLNDAAAWAAVALFGLAVAVQLRRAWLGRESWLPNWALNALGFAYLPVLIAEALAFGRSQPLRPVVHLILFALAAKLFSLRRERDKWQALVGVFFLFLSAMATSVHPSVVLYLVAFLALAVVALLRFAYLHLLASFGHQELPATPVPVGRFLVLAVGGTLLAAVPLFAILPRVRTPLVTAPAGFTGPPDRTAGFSDEMSLDLIGRIRENTAVALRLAPARQTPRPESIRLKAATYERWEGRSWGRSPREEGILPERFLGFRLAPGEPVGEMRIFLEPLGTTGLPLPVETIAVDADLPTLDVDRGGAALLRFAPTRQVEYVALLGPRPLSAAAEPEADDPTLDRAGVTREIAELAGRWAGEGTPLVQAGRLEARFHRELRYSTAFVGRGGADPIGDFLFRTREGHCEYFASAMVLTLRARGIPARLVTGFYGAEESLWESALIVRQSNAHAWVEAYVDGRWQVFDPTPPSGMPGASPADFLLYARQALDGLVFQWDRYVLGFDFDDQVGLIGALRAAWDRLMEQLRRPEPPPAAPAAPVVVPAGGASAAAPAWGRRALVLAAVLSLVVAAAVVWFARRRRAAWTATDGYTRLRRSLRSAGLRVGASLPPLALADAAAARFPLVAAPVAELVALYLRESFAGRAATEEELARARSGLATIDRALAPARRARRRGHR